HNHHNHLKQNQGDVNDAMGSKKKTVVVNSDPLALIVEKTNVSRSKEKAVVSSNSKGSKVDDFRHFAKDCKKAKVKDYEYYKTKMLLAKKYKDEQVLLAEDQAWMESSSDSDQEINANMIFMAQIEKVLSDSEASSTSSDEKISKEKYAKLEAERYEYMIRYSAYFDNVLNKLHGYPNTPNTRNHQINKHTNPNTNKPNNKEPQGTNETKNKKQDEMNNGRILD
nr:hypothetical protein [Tanacetum cinerariifolium]